MRNVGIFYEFGKGGLVQDYHQAQQWSQKAKARWNSHAQEDCDRIDVK
jgi:hypothetical protein